MIVIFNPKLNLCEVYTTKAGAARGQKVSRQTILRAIKTGKPFKKDFLAYDRKAIKLKKTRKSKNILSEFGMRILSVK